VGYLDGIGCTVITLQVAQCVCAPCGRCVGAAAARQVSACVPLAVTSCAVLLCRRWGAACAALASCTAMPVRRTLSVLQSVRARSASRWSAPRAVGSLHTTPTAGGGEGARGGVGRVLQPAVACSWLTTPAFESPAELAQLWWLQAVVGCCVVHGQ
jgi:hypothetical protein